MTKTNISTPVDLNIPMLLNCSVKLSWTIFPQSESFSQVREFISQTFSVNETMINFNTAVCLISLTLLYDTDIL